VSDETDRSEVDAAEQEAVVEEDQVQLPVDTSADASEGDLLEQAVEVPIHDEDEVR